MTTDLWVGGHHEPLLEDYHRPGRLDNPRQDVGTGFFKAEAQERTKRQK
jgi:hypothetical protein